MLSHRVVLLVAAACVLPAWPAHAGAPAPHLRARVWTPLPLGARVRVELELLRMPLPDGLAKKLKLLKDGKPVAGKWIEDNRAPFTCGQRVRLAFKPAAPLAAGTYKVTGLPRNFSRPGGGKHMVTITAQRDTTPPTFAGLRGVYCMRPNPLLGCQPYGLGLRAHEASDASGVRLVAHVRGFGKPYLSTARVQTDLLPYDANRLLGSLSKGRYIVTLRAMDRADNAGGKVCEVLLRLPVSSCKSFPGAGPGGKRSIVRGLGTGMFRARCARKHRKGGWVSAIDGVRLHFKTIR